MTGLKMGPKHKGFPMTQSIHFDSRERKRFWVLHLLEAQVYIVWKCLWKTSLIKQIIIFTQRNGSYTLRDAQCKKRKRDGTYTLMKAHDQIWFKVLKDIWKETLILYFFQRIIKFKHGYKVYVWIQACYDHQTILRMRQNIDVRCLTWFEWRRIKKIDFLGHKRTYFQLNQR